MSQQKKSLASRIADRTTQDPASDCLLWTGSLSTQGKYPTVAQDGTGKQPLYVHRIAAGPEPDFPPPDGSHRWEVHHMCFRRRCVNPEHLIWLTNRQHHAIHSVIREAEAAERRNTAA